MWQLGLRVDNCVTVWGITVKMTVCTSSFKLFDIKTEEQKQTIAVEFKHRKLWANAVQKCMH